MFSNKAIRQYLRVYAEPQASAVSEQLLRLLPGTTWENVVLIPVCGEDASDFDRIFHSSHAQSGAVLAIVCLNRPDSHPRGQEWLVLNTRWLQARIQTARYVHWLSDSACFLSGGGLPDCLVVLRMGLSNGADGHNQPIPARQGVGLARKLIADVALSLMDAGAVRQPWLFSTDADARLPADYFMAPQRLPESAAAISLPFIHCAESHHVTHRLRLAQRLYDARLFLYRRGIALVNPQYAWVPLGSALVISALAYARVRGFPRRNAGEDFYLLNKVAKTGKIHGLHSVAAHGSSLPVVQLRIRMSDRVPFGTGPAVRAIAGLEEPVNDYRFYHPELFMQLARWRERVLERLRDVPGLGSTGPIPEVDHCLTAALGVSAFFKRLDIQRTGYAQRLRQWDEWLDAFRLLKAVHALEALYRPLTVSQLRDNNYFREHFSTDLMVTKAFHDLWPIARDSAGASMP